MMNEMYNIILQLNKNKNIVRSIFHRFFYYYSLLWLLYLGRNVGTLYEPRLSCNKNMPTAFTYECMALSSNNYFDLKIIIMSFRFRLIFGIIRVKKCVKSDDDGGGKGKQHTC